jgi:Spy/CpxP family protein refolding chaperone
MKKLILFALILGFTHSVAFSQAKGKNKGQAKQQTEKNGEKRLQEMTALLSLTADQQEKIKTIAKESKEKMKADRQKYKGNKKCLAKAKYQNKVARKDKLMAVLTPEQQTKWTAEVERKKQEKKKKKKEELSQPIECK